MLLKNFHKLTALLSFLTLTIVSCGTKSHDLSTGTWRATIKNESGTEVPFNFEVTDSAGVRRLYILNASDRLLVDDIAVNRDSVTIKLPLFDSEIKAGFTADGFSGKWIKHLVDKDVAMEITASKDVSYRFFKDNPDVPEQIGGRWSTTIVSLDNKDTTIAVGEFRQEKSRVTGSFLTSTGDYRFLEGAISSGRLFLSTFDGSNCMLFTGTIEGNTIIDGKFYSGLSTVRNWSARKDEHAILPDAYTLTSLKPGYTSLSFSFPDLDGKQVSLKDPRYKDKVVIISFLGSWCPNCMDETAFLTKFYKEYKSKGVEIIGLAYERTNDIERSKNSLEQLRKRFNISYPVLVTGHTNKEVLKSIPELNEFRAFPTTIIIDKQGKVNKIHTGFSGPGTGQHYTDYVQEFETHINKLLANK
ncbi:MAG: TlpA disulfide reductase family protein [Arcticibacter sp.]